MKLSKAQAFLLSRIANGEIIQRNGQGKFDTWYSTDIHGLHVNYETAKILLSCGAVEEREIREGKFYRRFQLVIPNNIDYAADSGDFDTASRITPDPAGEDVAADDGRPVDWELMYAEVFDLRLGLNDYRRWLMAHGFIDHLFAWDYDLMIAERDIMGNRYMKHA